MVNVSIYAIISTIVLLWGHPGLSKEKSKHPIYNSIVTLRPNINRGFAMKLSNYIHRYAKHYGTDPLRTVAIMMQESSIRNIHRRQQVLIIKEECQTPVFMSGDLVIEENIHELDRKVDECVEYAQVATGYTDVGIYQFHAATIHAYGMDALRLRDDVEYATERHCFLLAVKMRECAGLGQESWSCYHSRTPKYRKKYVKYVERYYKRITGGATQ